MLLQGLRQAQPPTLALPPLPRPGAPQGRWLMWGWLQERRKVGSYSYAGCLTLPRVLHCTEDGRLVQVGGAWGATVGWLGCCVWP